MRTETDKFEFDGDRIFAEPSVFDNEICLNIEKVRHNGGSYGYLDKEQAVKFAKQILEMCEGCN